MRTICALLSVGLLVAMPAGTVARSDDDWVFVTGTEYDVTCDGSMCTGRDELSDPRASGPVELTLELECSEDLTCAMGGVAGSITGEDDA